MEEFQDSEEYGTYSDNSYQTTPISSAGSEGRSPNPKLKFTSHDTFSRHNRYGLENEHMTRKKGLDNSNNANFNRIQFNHSPRDQFNSIPFSMDGTGDNLKRNGARKCPSGHLTPKLVMSGISKIAIPSFMKDKDENDLHFGNVLVLHLQCKNIKFLTPGVLDPFINLKNLYMYKNNVRRIQGLDHLCNLEMLDLSRNNVERIDNLSKCKKLKKLFLGFNEIQVVEGLEGLNSLEELQIDDQDIPPEQPLIFSPGIMESISTTLLVLDISSNQLSTLAPVANLYMLDSLNAANNNLSDIGKVLSVLQTLHQLRSLQLKGNPIAKKPTYKSSIIGVVCRLETLDDKTINDTTRTCVQNLRLMKEFRARQSKEKLQLQENKSINQVKHEAIPSDFHFATPTRSSSLPFPPPPTPFKLTKKKSSTSSKVVPVISKSLSASAQNSMLSFPTHSSSSVDLDGSNYESKARSIQASEFKDKFTLDHDDDGMSDMAKIIFRLSDLEDLGGSGDAKVLPSNYWDLPGTSMIRECRPLSPLEGVDLSEATSLPTSLSSPELGINSISEAKLLSTSSSSFSRPKPASPGGRRSSQNSGPVAVAACSSVPNFSISVNDGNILSQQSQQQKYYFGRTLSPLIELPTPESLTAREEKN